MILGCKETLIYRLLSDCGIDFHLTGSRRYGGYTVTSDWDFFVQSSPDTINWLEANGFIQLPNGIYTKQQNTERVYKHGELPVHVICCDDLRLALDAQDVIIGLRLLDFCISTKDVKSMWIRVYSYLRSGS